MRRKLLYPLVAPLVATAAVAAALVVATPAAFAHGYVSAPPSRQALCANGTVPDCGQIQYEPQSVEGPKGLTSCSGGNAQFAVLDDDSKGWPATPVGTVVTFTWTFTARHATLDFEYWIGGTLLASFDGGGHQPPETVAHQVSLAGFSGRQKILAVWNISDTANAFYSCIDVQVGGGGGGGPTPTPTPTATPTPTQGPSLPPTMSPTPRPSSTQTGGTTWQAGVAYKVGDVVTYAGIQYACLQAHTALPGWEPPNVPALWQRL